MNRELRPERRVQLLEGLLCGSASGACALRGIPDAELWVQRSDGMHGNYCCTYMCTSGLLQFQVTLAGKVLDVVGVQDAPRHPDVVLRRVCTARRFNAQETAEGLLLQEQLERELLAEPDESVARGAVLAADPVHPLLERFRQELIEELEATKLTITGGLRDLRQTPDIDLHFTVTGQAVAELEVVAYASKAWRSWEEAFLPIGGLRIVAADMDLGKAYHSLDAGLQLRYTGLTFGNRIEFFTHP